MTLALLDTDMLSELIKLQNPAVRQHALDYTQQFGQLSFSAITLYEILRGYKQKKATKQLARFAVFCQKSLILPVTDARRPAAPDCDAPFQPFAGPPGALGQTRRTSPLRSLARRAALCVPCRLRAASA